jgi:biopolymer transport protein ExbD
MAFASFDAKRQNTPMAEINMIPLIDVMLVLLVIFIVTAPLLTHAVKLDLPKVNSQVNQPPPERIEYVIDKRGQRYWDGEPVERATAQQRFAVAGKRRPQPEVHIRADENVAYRFVAESLADASKAGLSKIGFVSRPEDK